MHAVLTGLSCISHDMELKPRVAMLGGAVVHSCCSHVALRRSAHWKWLREALTVRVQLLGGDRRSHYGYALSVEECVIVVGVRRSCCRRVQRLLLDDLWDRLA